MTAWSGAANRRRCGVVRAVAVWLLTAAVSTATPGFQAPPAPDVPPSPEELTAAEIATRYAPAVVVISVRLRDDRRGKYGTGFVVDPSGTIVTCLHVLDGAREVTIITAGGDKHRRPRVRAFDAERDLALLAIDAEDLPAVELGTSAELVVGEALVTIGHPLGLASSVTDGVLSAWRDPPRRPEESPGDEPAPLPQMRGMPRSRLLQISVPIAPGSSGGPVFDRHGRVVGVAAAGVHYGTLDLNFALPIEGAAALLSFDWGLDLTGLQERADDARADLAEPHLAEARLALALERHDEAAWHLDRALALNPRSLEALLLQAGALQREGDFGGAEQLLLRATDLAPNSADAWARLGEFYLTPALDLPLVAGEDVLIGAQGSGPSPRRQAMEALRRALELDEEHAVAAHGVGSLLFTEGRFREAADKFRQAVESDPEQLLAGVRLGESHMMLRQYDEAAAAYEGVLDRNADSALAHHGMARVSSVRLDLAAAREHWRRFLELSEGQPELSALRERSLLYLERYLPGALPR